jgi:hypothetical protein
MNDHLSAPINNQLPPVDASMNDPLPPADTSDAVAVSDATRDNYCEIVETKVHIRTKYSICQSPASASMSQGVYDKLSQRLGLKAIIGKRKDPPESLLKSDQSKTEDDNDTKPEHANLEMDEAIPACAGVSIEPPSKKKHPSLCRVVGCKKQHQTNNKGFCRSHYNLIYDGISEQDPYWLCPCGQQVSEHRSRCGVCFGEF